MACSFYPPKDKSPCYSTGLSTYLKKLPSPKVFDFTPRLLLTLQLASSTEYFFIFHLLTVTCRPSSFQVDWLDRGFARVFQLSPSQKEDKTYYNFICNLEYGLMDNDLCDRDSCLDCKKLETCPFFRVLYERKKEVTQFSKYEQIKQDAIIKESRELTLDQILKIAYDLKDKFTTEKAINARKLRLILKEPPTKIIIGHNKAYDLKTLLEYRYPDDFKKT